MGSVSGDFNRALAAVPVLGTIVSSVAGAIEANDAADEAEQQARRRRQREDQQIAIATNQTTRDLRRRAVVQADAMRVAAGASGVAGGTAQAVLESAVATQLREDLTTAGLNQASRLQANREGLNDTLTRINNTRQNVFLAGAQGAVQGVVQGAQVYSSLGGSGGNETLPQPTDLGQLNMRTPSPGSRIGNDAFSPIQIPNRGTA